MPESPYPKREWQRLLSTPEECAGFIAALKTLSDKEKQIYITQNYIPSKIGELAKLYGFDDVREISLCTCGSTNPTKILRSEKFFQEYLTIKAKLARKMIDLGIIPQTTQNNANKRLIEIELCLSYECTKNIPEPDILRDLDGWKLWSRNKSNIVARFLLESCSE